MRRKTRNAAYWRRFTRKRRHFIRPLHWTEVELKRWGDPLEWHGLSEWRCVANSRGTPSELIRGPELPVGQQSAGQTTRVAMPEFSGMSRLRGGRSAVDALVATVPSDDFASSTANTTIGGGPFARDGFFDDFVDLQKTCAQGNHSDRSAWMTSTRAARAAGRIEATTAAPNSTNAETITGSAPGIFKSPK